MNKSSGFTVIELLAAIVLLTLLGAVSFDRYQSIQRVHRDHDRKTAINTIHANLEEVVRPSVNGYPRLLSASQLTAMDAALLKDPGGKAIGTSGSDYRYEPTGCNGGDVCSGYTLRANLENEMDYVRTQSKT